MTIRQHPYTPFFTSRPSNDLNTGFGAKSDLEKYYKKLNRLPYLRQLAHNYYNITPYRRRMTTFVKGNVRIEFIRALAPTDRVRDA